MFIIATNDRETYAFARVDAARTIEDAREKFIAAWHQLYDTSTVVLVKINDDLTRRRIFEAYSDPVEYKGEDADGHDIFEIDPKELAKLDEALAAFSAS